MQLSCLIKDDAYRKVVFGGECFASFVSAVFNNVKLFFQMIPWK